MLFNKNNVIIMAVLMLLSPFASTAPYYDAKAEDRDVEVHYPRGGWKRTMHGHSSMNNIPFGSAFNEKHTKGKAPDFFHVWIRGRTTFPFYIRGAYTYNVYARACDSTATTCVGVGLQHRTFILKQGVSDGLSPLRMDEMPTFSMFDTADAAKTHWGVTFCTGLENNNNIYKVDDAACPGLSPPPPPECPLGEY